MAIFDLFKKFRVIKKETIKEMEKGLNDLKTIKNYLRPEDDNDFFSINRTQSWGSFDSKVNSVELYQLSVYSDILQNVLNTLKNEMFRCGFNYTPKTTYENKLQLKKIERIEKKANENYQTLKEVFMEFENDMNIIDDGYLLARKNYFLNCYNEVIGSEVEEIIRVDPLSVEMIFDTSNRLGYNKAGKPLYFDLENRGEITEKEFNKNGIRNSKACYKIRVGSNSKTGKSSYQYYDSSELLHCSKYHPTKTYGFSPLYSLYNKAITLINMDYYIKQYYSGNKVPKGILTVNTSNAQGFWTFWDTFIEKTRKNPHSVNPLIHQSAEGKDAIKWVDFMRNLQEMQYTEVRNEIRTQMGSVYNVSPIFQNDVSTGGGLNNEGLQITVTDRGVQMGQSIYNEKVLPWLCEQLGITDYTWTLNPSKEEDKVYEKDLRLKELAIAKSTAELGIKVTMNDTGDFSYTEGVVDIQPEQPGMTDFFKTGLKLTKKLSTVPKKEQEKLENALLTELKKLLSKLDIKTKLSEKELEKKIKGISKDFEKILKIKTSSKLNAIYRKAMNDMSKELGEKFTIGKQDKNIIDALKREPVYQESFKNIKADLSDKLKNVITTAYDKKEGFTVNQLVEEMKETTEEMESQLRTIARTETTKISAAARKVQYDKTGDEYKYFHIGPSDNRETKMSREVKKLTKNGVSWDEYVKIIEQVSKKYNPKWIVNKEAPITHPNTRHIFVARRV